MATKASAVDELHNLAERARSAQTVDGILAAEAAGAKTYWEALAGTPVRFPRAELAKIPGHWLSFGPRSSPVGGRNRNAANPANAILGYLYRLAEAVATLALATLGLDPGVGLWHVDTAGRDSLTLDVLEAIRPRVDGYLFEILAERTFSWSDFHETAQGVCRSLRRSPTSLPQRCRCWRVGSRRWLRTLPTRSVAQQTLRSSLVRV